MRLVPTIHRGCLLLRWWGRFIAIGSRSLPVVHFDKAGFCRHNRGFGGRHQWLDGHERGGLIDHHQAVTQPESRHRDRARDLTETEIKETPSIWRGNEKVIRERTGTQTQGVNEIVRVKESNRRIFNEVDRLAITTFLHKGWTARDQPASGSALELFEP